MDNKTKLRIWIIVDIVLLVLAYFSVSAYFHLSATLKSPCAVCASENPAFDLCTKNLQKENRLLNPYEINITKIINERNGEG